MKQGVTYAGRYKLTRHIGTGGFAQVWKAEDTMAENATVAIKIFAPDKGMDADGIKVFRREFALTLPLNHPHLLKTYHFDVYEGSPYLIMPFCREGSLMGKVADEYAFSEKELAMVLRQLAGALGHLHQEGINHQDMKPDNVLIFKPGHYVLSDFGISSKARRTVARSMRAEEAKGYSAFTPAYAPPEKYISKPGPAGDIFSLGVSLYELATGDVPFEDIGAAMERGANIPDLPARFSPAFNAWLMACLNYKPAERPTAGELEKAAFHYLQQSSWPTRSSQEPLPKKKHPVRRTEKMVQAPNIPDPVSLKEEPTTQEKSAAPKSGKGRVWIMAAILLILVSTGAYLGKDLFASEDPNSAAFLIAAGKGDSLVQVNNFAEARKQYQLATSLMPEDKTIAQKMSILETLEKSQRAKGNKFVAIGDSLMALHEFGAATESFQKALEPMPTEQNWLKKHQMAQDSLAAQEAQLAHSQAVDDSLKRIKKTSSDAFAQKKAPYEWVGEFKHGLAIAKSRKNYKFGVINSDYQPVIPLEYGNVSRCGSRFFIMTDKTQGEEPSYTKRKEGLFSHTGQQLTPLKYVDIECFSEGLAAVKLYEGYGDFPWGYIDENGREVISPKYFSVEPFKGGMAKVTEQGGENPPHYKGNSYFIDKSGNCVKDCP